MRHRVHLIADFPLPFRDEVGLRHRAPPIAHFEIGFLADFHVRDFKRGLLRHHLAIFGRHEPADAEAVQQLGHRILSTAIDFLIIPCEQQPIALAHNDESFLRPCRSQPSRYLGIKRLAECAPADHDDIARRLLVIADDRQFRSRDLLDIDLQIPRRRRDLAGYGRNIVNLVRLQIG